MQIVHATSDEIWLTVLPREMSAIQFRRLILQKSSKSGILKLKMKLPWDHWTQAFRGRAVFNLLHINIGVCVISDYN